MLGFRNLLLGCLLGSLVFTSPIWAKDSPHPPRFSLNQLEKLVLGRNANLKALHYQLESAFHQLEGDRLQRWPRLRANYNYYPQSQLADEDSVSFYEQRGEIALVYPLIDALLNRRYSQQEKQVVVEEKQALLQAGRLELLRQLRYQYVAALKEKRLLAEYRQHEAELSRWLEQAKQRYYYKQSLLLEVLDIEALQLSNQQLLAQHRQNYSLRLSRLGQLAGLEDREWEPVAFLASLPSLPNKQDLLAMSNQHPLVRVYQLKALREEARLAGSWFKPLRLEAEAGYIVEQDADSDSQSGARLGLRFSIPLAYPKLEDYRQLSLRDEWKRWQAEASAQKQKLKQQLLTTLTQLKGISHQRELTQKQIQQAEAKIKFLQTQMEHPLSEPEHPWQRLIAAYQQQWKAQKRLIDLDYQQHTAYYELLYLSGRYEFSGSVPWVNGPRTPLIPSADSRPYLAPRALYIKHTNPLAAPEEQKFLLQFCRSKGINQIFLNADQLFVSPPAPAWLPEFISRLHQAGISVWAIVIPDNPPATVWLPTVWAATDVAQLIDPTPLLNYNQQHLGSEAFDGLHLHLILPRSLGDNSEALKAKLNQLLILCRQLSQRLKALPHPLQLGLTIPHWYNQLDMQLLADSIYYADELIITLPEGLGGAKLLEGVGDEIRLGEEMGRRIWLAIDCSHFSHADQPELENYIEQLQKQWQYQLRFAIFDYQTYQALQER